MKCFVFCVVNEAENPFETEDEEKGEADEVDQPKDGKTENLSESKSQTYALTQRVVVDDSPAVLSLLLTLEKILNYGLKGDVLSVGVEDMTAAC